MDPVSARGVFFRRAASDNHGPGLSALALSRIFHTAWEAAEHNPPVIGDQQRATLAMLRGWMTMGGEQDGLDEHDVRSCAAWIAVYQTLIGTPAERCTRCGSRDDLDEHRCPTPWRSLDDEQSRAADTIDQLLPDSLLAALGLTDPSDRSALRWQFIRAMRLLTDADEDWKQIKAACFAMQHVFGWAGFAPPPDIAAVTAVDDRPAACSWRVTPFPATWPAYAEMLRAVLNRGLLVPERTADSWGRPGVSADAAPVWSILGYRTYRRVVLRIPRPAGEHDYPWFITLIPGPDEDEEYLGRLHWNLDDEPDLIVLREPPPRPASEPRWQRLAEDLIPEVLRGPLQLARAGETYRDRAVEVARLAAAYKAHQQLLLEEAVAWAREAPPETAFRHLLIALGEVAAVAYTTIGVEAARFVAGSMATEYWSASVLREARRRLSDGADLGPLYQAMRDFSARGPNAESALSITARNAAMDGLSDHAIAALGDIRNSFTQAECALELVDDLSTASLPAYIAVARTIAAEEEAAGGRRWAHHAQYRAQALAAALPRMKPAEAAALAGEVLVLIGESVRPETATAFAKALVARTPLSPPAERQQIVEQLATLPTPEDDRSWGSGAASLRLRSLTELLPHLKGPEREHVYTIVLAGVYQLPNDERLERPRLSTLRRLLPLLADADRPAAYEQILADIEESTSWLGLDDYLNLIPGLDDAQQERLRTVLRPTLDRWFPDARAAITARLGFPTD